MEENDKDIFFVEIRESDEIRRNVLETIMDIVKNLQRIENFKEARKKKIENINKLWNFVCEINNILPNLKICLAEAKIRVESKRKSSKKKIITKKKTPDEIAKRKPVTELRKLESELSEIESKLQGLS